MGFPQRNAEGAAGQAFVGQDAKLQSGGFTCPRCKCVAHQATDMTDRAASRVVVITTSGPTEQLRPGTPYHGGPTLRSERRSRVAELPGACHVCGLTLVSSPHLARSYHHLFPVRAFDEVPPAEVARLAQVSRRVLAHS